MHRIVLGVAFALTATAANAALVIAKAPTSNVTCAGGVCTATAADAVLNVKAARTMLAAGDLTIASGSAAMDIDFKEALDWAASNRLILDAYRSILVTMPVTSQGTGGVTLITNDGGSGGDYSFADKGKIAFWDTTSSLIINGKSFMLVNDVAGLAAAVHSAPSGAFALAKYYDASVDGRYRAPPISTPFSGSFEGLGHTIDNLRLIASIGTKKKQFGFFHNIRFGGMVRDITLDHATVQTNCHGDQVGGLAAISDGTILHATFNGSVRGGDQESNIGGLVGQNYADGIVRDGHSLGAVIGCATGFTVAGGLAGRNDGMVALSDSSSRVEALRPAGLVSRNTGMMQQCHATGSADVGSRTFATGSGVAGGLVSDNSGIIDRCYATGVVDGGSGHGAISNYAGGITGDNSGIITQSFATGEVGIDDIGYSGGVFGGGAGEVENSYSTGSVSSSNYVGGFIGDAIQQPSVKTSYAMGHVYGSVRGGFLGWNEAKPNSFAQDYFDIDTTATTKGCGIGDCTGITGLTDTQLKSGLPSGFDPAIWGQSAGINNGYPYLKANPPPQ